MVPVTVLHEMFVLYDHPEDFPNHFVLRRWVLLSTKVRSPTVDFFLWTDIQYARRWCLSRGLKCFTREPDDIPCIVETWL